MFWLIEPSSGQIQNTVPVHSVNKHYEILYCLQDCIDIVNNMGSRSVHSLNAPVLCFVFGLMMAQWAETCRRSYNC